MSSLIPLDITMNTKYLYGLLALILVCAVFELVSYNSSSAPLANQVQSGTQAASVAQNSVHTVVWNRSQFPSASVSLALIRQTSIKPASYAVVRTLSASVPNNGSATWTPAPGEIDGTTFIQIGCVAATSACQATLTPAI